MRVRSNSLVKTGAFGIAVLVVAACATAPTSVPEELAPAPLPPPAAAFAFDADDARVRADGQLAAQTGTLESEWGCAVEYEYYEPPTAAAARIEGAAPGLVVLGHGFTRDLTTMRGWARAWSERGMRTVVVGFCNSSVFNGRHDRNAADLVAVATRIEPGDAPIVYAGFSAGGLAALLAAGSDPRAIAYLGLDPVDRGHLAATVERLRMPALFLYAAPSRCNANANMVPVMPEADVRVALRVPFASHCDFEMPYDTACERLCGGVEPEETAREVRATIRALATAWVIAQIGADPRAAAVFGRPALDELERARRVEVLSVETAGR